MDRRLAIPSSRLGLAILLVVSLSAAAAVPVAADWPHPGGNAGYERGTTSAGQDVGSWAFNVSVDVASQLVYADGRVYFYDAEGRLHAFDPGESDREWFYGLEGPPPASPIVANGTVYGVDRNGIVALDRSGDVIWEVGLDGDLVGAPMVSEGTVYLVDGDTIRALDARTGDERWHRQVELPWIAEVDEAQASGDDLSIRNLVAAEDGIYVVGGQEIRLREVAGRMREALRQERYNGSAGDGATSLTDGPAESPYAYVEDEKLWVEGHERDGGRMWKATGLLPGRPPSAGDGSVYVTDMPSGVAAVDAQRGSVEWTTDIGAEPSTTPIYSDEGLVYVATRSGELRALDADSGDPVWVVELPDLSSPRLALGDGSLFVTSTSQRDRLQVVDAADGSLEWNTSLEFSLARSARPTVVGDSVLLASETRIFAVEDGRVEEPVAVVDRFYEGGIRERLRRAATEDEEERTDQGDNVSKGRQRSDVSVDETVEEQVNPSIRFSPLTPIVIASLVLIAITSVYLYRRRE